MPDAEPSDPVLVPILALLVEQREARSPKPEIKIELLLNRCGVSNEVIGEILGKKPDSIRVALARASEGPSKKGSAKRG